MKSLVKLIRPLNCLLSSASILIITLLLYGLDQPPLSLIYVTLLGMAVVGLFTAGGNTMNDYFDREVDRINHPERPIPSGKIAPKHALIFSSVLFSSSALCSLFLPWFLPQLIVLINLFIMISYEMKLKKRGLVGNLSIAWLTGSLFIFGGAIYGRLELPIILGIMAFLATAGREITKDIQDMKGDLSRDTFPMRVGIKKARISVGTFLVAGVIVSPYPYIRGLLSIPYLVVVLLADTIFIYSIFLLKDAEKAQKLIKVGMIVALAAFLVGGIL